MPHPETKKIDIILDIETEGISSELQLKTFEPEFEADTRLKDPAKIDLDKAEKRDKWLERAACDASRASILTIGIFQNGKPEIWEGLEVSLIQKFWEFWMARSFRRIIGHNIKGFDMPFIIRRSYVLGVRVPNDVIGARYLHSDIVDTMEVWAAGEWGNKISLDNLGRALGVGKKNGHGKDFSSLYHIDKAKAIEYAKNDLVLTAACAKKMGLFNG